MEGKQDWKEPEGAIDESAGLDGSQVRVRELDVEEER